MSVATAQIRHRDLLTPEHLANPYPLLAELRNREVQQASERLGSVWLLSYDTVSAALRDPRLSVAVVGDRLNRLATVGLKPDERLEFAAAFRARSDMLFYLDPPRHTHARRLLQGWFTPAFVESLRARIDLIARQLIDSVKPGEAFDLMETIAGPLPALVIADVLGIAPERARMIVNLSDGLVATASRGALDRKWTEGGKRVIDEFDLALKEEMSFHRQAKSNDLLSHLVRAVDSGLCSEPELLGLCMSLAVGGYETTRGAIGNAFATLLRHPRALARIRADRSLIDSAIEEIIRFESPVQITARVATEPAEYGEITIQEGQLVECFIGAANRDPAQFVDPDSFLIDRQPNRHLGFSLGHHHCLGFALARAEATSVLRTAVDRWPDMELVEPEIAWKANGMFRQPERLPVRFS